MPNRYQRIIGFVVAAFGLFFIRMGTWTFVEGRALAAHGAVVVADLVATSNRESDSDTGHQVRYRFHFGDRSYERVGVFGTAVGSDVSAETQADAIATGHIAVRYLPEDPSVNEPVAYAVQRERGLIAGGLGLVLLIAGMLRLLLARKSADLR